MHADKLTKQEIVGIDLAGLTEEKLVGWGWPGGRAMTLVMASCRLWKKIEITGVTLAPVSKTKSKIIELGELNIIQVRGKDTRFLLGGLDQFLRYVSSNAVLKSLVSIHVTHVSCL